MFFFLTGDAHAQISMPDVNKMDRKNSCLWLSYDMPNQGILGYRIFNPEDPDGIGFWLVQSAPHPVNNSDIRDMMRTNESTTCM